MKYRVYLRGMGYIKFTDAKGNRKIKEYPTKKGAERRAKLEKSRGWKTRVVKK